MTTVFKDVFEEGRYWLLFVLAVVILMIVTNLVHLQPRPSQKCLDWCAQETSSGRDACEDFCVQHDF